MLLSQCDVPGHSEMIVPGQIVSEITNDNFECNNFVDGV